MEETEEIEVISLRIISRNRPLFSTKHFRLAEKISMDKILEEERFQGTDNEAVIRYMVGLLDPTSHSGEEIARHVEAMVERSSTRSLCWDALKERVLNCPRDWGPLPERLFEWLCDVASGDRSRPDTSGSTIARDLALACAVKFSLLGTKRKRGESMPARRNAERIQKLKAKEPRLRNRFHWCCEEGGSFCDAAGGAWNELARQGLVKGGDVSYSTVEKAHTQHGKLPFFQLNVRGWVSRLLESGKAS